VARTPILIGISIIRNDAGIVDPARNGRPSLDCALAATMAGTATQGH